MVALFSTNLYQSVQNGQIEASDPEDCKTLCELIYSAVNPAEKNS